MIPRHVDDRHRVCGVTPERWDAVWARIAGRFEPLDDDGNLGHPRTTRERPLAIAKWKRNKDIAKKRKATGRQGGKGRANKQQHEPQTNFLSYPECANHFVPSKTPSKTLAIASRLLEQEKEENKEEEKEKEKESNTKKEKEKQEEERKEEREMRARASSYSSTEFADAWKLYEDHCHAIGGATQQKLDVDLMRLVGLCNETKAVQWLMHSVSVSKAGNLCDPDRFQHAPGSEASEARARRKDYRSMTAGEKKHAEKLRRERIVRGGREHGLSDEHIGALLKEAGFERD